MNTSDFDYHLPEECIAFNPTRERQNSRLMVLKREEETVSHKNFYELPVILRKGDLLVLNNTKVIPARLVGQKKPGQRIEILLIQNVTSSKWKCMVRKPRQGMEVKFDQGVNGILSKGSDNSWLIEFNADVSSFLDNIGKMPLPPYIKRDPNENDKISYQTVFAESPGAIAAPTAGLHFTRELIREIKEKEIEIRYVTLHVGIGTFLPVKTEDLKQHNMHGEYREIPEDTASAVNRAKTEGRRVIAVGTTVVRTLESAVNVRGRIERNSGETNLFIYPGYKFKIIDGLITNFHVPRSTLLMLVSAFAGREYILRAYEEAKLKGYRFLSYGDAMFIN